MTAAELKRTGAFVLACIAAGMAIALLVVVVFPELAGGALSRLTGDRSAAPAAIAPVTTPAPAAPMPARRQATAAAASPGDGAPQVDDSARRASLSDVLAPQPMFSYASAVRAS